MGVYGAKEIVVLIVCYISVVHSQYVNPGFGYASPEANLSYIDRTSLGCPNIYPGNGSFCCHNGPYMFNRSDLTNSYLRNMDLVLDKLKTDDVFLALSQRDSYVNIFSNNTFLEFTWYNSTSEWRNQFGLFLISSSNQVEKNSFFHVFKDMTGVSLANPFCHVLGDTVRVGPFMEGQKVGFFVRARGAENDRINIHNSTLNSNMTFCLSNFNFSNPDFYKCYRENGLSSYDPNGANKNESLSFLHSVRDLNLEKVIRFVSFRLKKDIIMGYQVGNISNLYSSGTIIFKIISQSSSESNQNHLVNFCQGADERINVSFNATSGSCICMTNFTGLTYNISVNACKCLGSLCECPKTTHNSTCICKYEEGSGECRMDGKWTCTDCSNTVDKPKTTSKTSRVRPTDDFFDNILLILVGLGAGITSIAILASVFVAYGRGYRRKMNRLKAKKSQMNLLATSSNALQRTVPMQMSLSNQSSGMLPYPMSSQQRSPSSNNSQMQAIVAPSPVFNPNQVNTSPKMAIQAPPVQTISSTPNSNIAKENGPKKPASSAQQPPKRYDSKSKLEELNPKVFLKMHSKDLKSSSVGVKLYSSSTDATVTQNVTSGYLTLKMDVDLVIPDILMKIGKGGTASIYKGTLINDEIIMRHGGTREVAIKVSEPKPNETEEKRKRRFEDFMYEIAIMSSVPPCPNVVQFIGFIEAPLQCIVMKHYSSSLSSIIGDPKVRILPEMVMNIGCQIANGMVAIHDKRILHLDIKPNNILMEFLPDGTFECVICDFGFASLIGDSQERVVSGLNVPTTTGITFRYCAPELFDRIAQGELSAGRVSGELDKMIDVYAYSITMYEVMYRKSPWLHMDKKDIATRVRSGERPTLPDPGSKEDLQYKGTPQLIKVLTSCWAENPESRMTFIEIKTLLSS